MRYTRRNIMVCPVCAAENSTGSRFCNGCGGLLSTDGARTMTLVDAKRESSSSSDAEGRYAAGSVLGNRYRILGLLGRGGMGEVYRAHDIKLNQSVALKFLPPETGSRPGVLERFRGEVRIARQVSHPNVCRVYDLGELDGAPFLSMEYVDGEDLHSLLRRIGRLPADKAVEVARKLCAGLAAAHAKGVLHRDLKPANIMIDGQGQVLIMDFGLAAAIGSIAETDIRSGTPAYMAPEQRAGREVTERSDIYSLGLILREMSTGARDAGGAGSAKDADPAVEKLIQRCLDPDPSKRPATALDVARALPGGDPLAEALAAGDTPSPEMVAASDDTGVLSVRAAVICLGAVVAGIAVALLLSNRTNLLNQMPFNNSKEILANKAEQMIQAFGYTDPPIDRFSDFAIRADFFRYGVEKLNPEENRNLVAKGQPALVAFRYRQSPRYLETLGSSGEVSFENPPAIVSGMVEIQLDPQGRLLEFSAVPPQLDSAAPAAKPVDWNALLAAAGLDPARWTPTESQRIPLVSFDARAAWKGSYETSQIPIRIEAASWKGRPVYFSVCGPWTLANRMQQPSSASNPAPIGAMILVYVVLAFSSFLAWRNYRFQRGDLSGSARLAIFGFACSLLIWLAGGHHVLTVNLALTMVKAIGDSLFSAAFLWVLYMALEPYVRRRWPQSLISWTRLWAGGWRDPLVGGHVLAGATLGIGFTLFFALRTALSARFTGVVATNPAFALAYLQGNSLTLATSVDQLQGSVGIGLSLFFIFFLFRVLLRRTWLAVTAVLLIVAFLRGSNPSTGINLRAILVGFAVLQILSGIGILVRFGVLPMVVAVFVSSVLPNAPLTLNLSAWYATAMYFPIAIVLGLALWSFRTTLSGRRLLSDNLFEV